MPQIQQFLKFLAVSPPSGLAVAEKGLTAKKIQTELAKMGIAHEIFEINTKSPASDFFNALDKVLKQKAWLVLDIKTPDVPGWFFEQMRTISGTGHLYNKEQDKDIPLGASRVLAIMSEKNLENSPFETLQSCFGIVFREQK